MSDFGDVDVDLLADYLGGALDGTPDADRVAALIAGDPGWAAASAALDSGMAAVTAELGTWGAAAEPMPADLAVRLDAALTGTPATGNANATDAAADNAAAGNAAARDAAAAGNAAADDVATRDAGAGDAAADDARAGDARAGDAVAGAGVAPEAGRDDRGARRGDDAAGGRPLSLVPGEGSAVRRRAARRLRWAAPIAVAAGILGLAGFAVDYLAGRSASDSGASSADMPVDSAAGAAEAAPSPLVAMADGTVAREPADRDIRESGTNYQADTLATAVAPSARTASDKDQSPPRELTRGADDELLRLRSPSALRACLEAIAAQNGGGPITVTGVDYARYQSEPAVIVRFTAANGRWAWASGAACGTPEAMADTRQSVRVGS